MDFEFMNLGLRRLFSLVTFWSTIFWWVRICSVVLQRFVGGFHGNLFLVFDRKVMLGFRGFLEAMDGSNKRSGPSICGFLSPNR